MYNLSILFVLSFLPYALLQTEDPHLCEKYVTVRYAVTERTPLQDYGRFAEHFSRLHIQGVMRTVVNKGQILKVFKSIFKTMRNIYTGQNKTGGSQRLLSRI